MTKYFKGKIALDIRDSVPDWEPYKQPEAPDGSPNILYIVIDDTGFGAWEMYGGDIKMPNLARIAERGMVFTNFHTTALCSPTRSSLLNGRNATSNGMSCIEECTTGFPGSSGRIPFENAFMSTVLQEKGYATFALGKWHLSPVEESNMASSKRHWPLGRGFERYYGFLGGETDQWYPDIVYDNHIIEPPYAPDMDNPDTGYHISKDLADKAITFVRDLKAIAPTKPWMMYFCPGANHAPHQIWPQMIAELGYNKAENLDYDGVNVTAAKYLQDSTFGDGYEVYRTKVLQQMKDWGIMDPEVQAAPINPHNEGILDTDGEVDHSQIVGVPDGKEWPQTDYVREWDTLSDNEKVLFCRMAEIYAAFSSYTDAQIGRLLDYLEETGQLDNTIIIACADNGASAEGGPNGSFNENLFFNDIPDTTEENMKHLNELGTLATYNHYPTGWAWGFDTPFKYWKRWSGYEGGAAAPFMMCGPGVKESTVEQPIGTAPYCYRKQYIHAVDVVPTVYELVGIEPPEVVKGYTQNAIEGISFAYTFDPSFASNDKRYAYALPEEEKPASGVRESQFYSMLGTRGIWYKGWLASTVHAPTPSDWSNFEDDIWELYSLDGHVAPNGLVMVPDPTQCNDLAKAGPEYRSKLELLKSAWYTMAGRYNGVPLDDRSTSVIMTEERPQQRAPDFEGHEDNPEAREDYVYYPGAAEVPEAVAVNVRTRSFKIAAVVDFGDPGGGVARRRKKRRARAVNPATGVLFAHGGRFGGHTLYLHHDGTNHKLCYVYNWLGMREQRVSCNLPSSLSGKMVLKVAFDKSASLTAGLNTDVYGGSVAGTVQLSTAQGEHPHMPTTDAAGQVLQLGTGATDSRTWTTFDGDPWVTQPSTFALTGEGLNIARDGGHPVSHDYEHPGELDGATVVKVVVTIKNDAEGTDQNKEFHRAMWKD